MKNTLKVVLFTIFSLVVLTFPALAATTGGISGCTLGGVGLQGSLSKITGLCNEFFATDKIMWYVILPFIAFTFIIWGVLSEIGLFRTKPQIHVALALLLSAMLLPTGAFGKVAIMLFTGGAMLTVISVVLVFFLGLQFWVNKKTREYAYAGIWSGWLGRILTMATFGFVGYYVAEMMEWDQAMITLGAVGVGFIWSMFSRNVRTMLGEDELKLMDKEIQRNIQLLGNLNNEKTRFQNLLAAATPGTPQYVATQDQIVRLDKEISSLEARIQDLERKSRQTFSKI